MNIVAVAACTIGIAHTYMAKEAIKKECARRGFNCKVETQGGMGIDDELEQDEVDAADFVLLAVAVAIEGEERFEKQADAGHVLTIDPAKAIAHPSEVIDQLIAL